MHNKTLLLAMLPVSIVACQDRVGTNEKAVEGTCEDWAVTEAKMIWPPDHEMHQFTLDDCVTITTTTCELPDPGPACGNGVVEGEEQCDDGNDNPFDGCDACVLVDTTPDKRDTSASVAPTSSATTVLRVTSITSNEQDDGSGDGTTSDDFAIVDDLTFLLRAERAGGAFGRQYRVHFVDQDGDTGACTFYVPSYTR